MYITEGDRYQGYTMLTKLQCMILRYYDVIQSMIVILLWLGVIAMK